MKRWTIGDPDAAAVAALAKQGGLPQICAGVLVSRGISTVEAAAEFFNQNENGEILSDPFLIKDMQIAADTVQAAIDDGRLICVYGDYDCDGITATALLYSYIECMGGNVIYYINQRSEGYGLCGDALRQLSEQGVELIVTVDNGISAIEEAKLAAELGMELIITDHHRPGDVLPEALAVVDPHREDDTAPFKDLCGCGVALKLAAAMDGGDYCSVMEQFSDLAAIATVADIVPLKGENREIVRQGLHYLENTENIGLKALMAAAGVKFPVSAVSAAFAIAPRINASGRFGSASEAVELLLCEDTETAETMAKRLDELNSSRKNAESDIMEDIRKYINENPEILNRRVLLLYGEGWHHGVIGIVASKLVDRFGKPAFILSDDGEAARGSARGVEGFSVYEALKACGEILAKYGGHSGAGGFSLKKEDLDSFNDALQKYAAAEYSEMPIKKLHADKLITPEELTAESVSSLGMLEPCGEGNPPPTFAMLSAKIMEVVPLSGGAHTKLILSYGNTAVTGLLFGVKTSDFYLRAGDTADMLVCPEINTYGGKTAVNVRITDYRKSGIVQRKYFAAKNAYENYKNGEGIDAALIPRIVPSLNELTAVYNAVPQDRAISFDVIFQTVGDSDINYCKLRLIIDIFGEVGLFGVDMYNETAVRLPVKQKVQLDDSTVLTELKSLFRKTEKIKL